MRLLEKGEIVPIQAIRKMDDVDKEEMSYAIELAQETLNNR
jgi:DNA-binding XRE family transcriptional regulator